MDFYIATYKSEYYDSELGTWNISLTGQKIVVIAEDLADATVKAAGCLAALEKGYRRITQTSGPARCPGLKVESSGIYGYHLAPVD